MLVPSDTPATQIQPRHLASFYYLLYFGAIGSLLPYLNLYYQETGLPTQRIGILASLITAISLVAGPIWSGLADKYHLHHWLLPMLLLATLPAAALLASVHTFGLLFLALTVFSIFLAPVVPLADHAVLNLLGDQHHDYGRLRLWGAVGWGSMALITGLLIEHLGMGMMFVAFVGSMAICGLIATQLPPPRLTVSVSYWCDARQFVSSKRTLGFLFSMILFGTAQSFLNNYFVLYIKSIGGGEGLFGLSVAAASLSEIPVFFLIPVFLRRQEPRKLIMLAFVAIIIRSLLYSAIRDPSWAVGAQLLHGPSFAAMWAAGVSHAHKLSVEGLGASAQAMLGTTLSGLGGMVGAYGGSLTYASIGPVALFQIGALIAFGGLMVFVITEWGSVPLIKLHNIC